MKISIVSVWFNEALFAPFFLAHYRYVDKIHIFLDAYTDDETEEICKQYDNVEVEKFAFPYHIFDEKVKMRKMDNFIASLESDWVYVLDADEFIFPKNGESARMVLARQSANLLYTQFWQSWRHKTDADLDPSKPSVYQRRYGSMYYKKKQRLSNKPIIVKPETGIRYKRGPHRYCANKKILVSEERFVGSHWKNADLDRAINKKKEKLKHSGIKQEINYNAINKKMRKAAEAHLNDSRMF